MPIRDEIAQRLAAAVATAQQRGTLPDAELPSVALERPQNPEHGDFASSLPLRLAKQARMNPLRIAEELAPLMDTSGLLEAVWAAPPGFVNLRLSPAWLQAPPT